MASPALTPPSDLIDVSGPPADLVEAPSGKQDHSTFTDALREYWNKINPLAQGAAIAGAVAHPGQAVQGYGQQTAGFLHDAEAAFKKGNYAEGIRHGLSFLLNGFPGIGASLDEAGNKAQAGDYVGAAADTAALATNLAAAKYAPAGATKVAEGIQKAGQTVGPMALKVAANPEVGTVVGAAAGETVGHPFIGAMAGRAASKALRSNMAARAAAEAKEIASGAVPAETPTPEPSRIVAPESEVSVPRPDWRQAIIDEANQPAHAAPEKVAESNTITNPQIAENGPQISAREAGNRTKLAQDMAAKMHEAGAPWDDARKLSPGDVFWKTLRSTVRDDAKQPSPATVQLALEHLKALEGETPRPSAQVAPINTPLRGRPLDIAKKLQAEMGR